MAVIERLGNFGGPNDPVTFRIIYRGNDQVYQGLPNTQYASKGEVKIEDL
jgi:hypothetical protein